MSRIGKKPINIPNGVEVVINGHDVKAKGPKGELSMTTHSNILLEKKDNVILVSVTDQEDKLTRSIWGTNRKLISNLVDGVSRGFEKKMEINGVGYNSSVAGNKLTLNVGYSHPVVFNVPAGLKVEVDKKIITISGADKHLVGETAAQIRKIRKPEPYKGKGIKYVEEQIRRKAGKASKK